jgi:NhaP-type Na+/H+ or K+/H+ antiporter
MPRLWNAENCWVKSFAVASLASNATASATWTGVTTDDIIMGRGTNTATAGCVGAYVSAADTVTFGPIAGTVGAQSTIAQTVWLALMAGPTSGEPGGASW